MKTRILNVLAILCGVIGLLLAIVTVMFFWSALTRIAEGPVVALSGILAVIYGLAAFLYIRAFISYRKSPNAEHAADILVGIAFTSWVSLTALPSFPGELYLFKYTIPKSIFLIALSYMFYRISKLILIKK